MLFVKYMYGVSILHWVCPVGLLNRGSTPARPIHAFCPLVGLLSVDVLAFCMDSSSSFYWLFPRSSCTRVCINTYVVLRNHRCGGGMTYSVRPARVHNPQDESQMGRGQCMGGAWAIGVRDPSPVAAHRLAFVWSTE